MTTREEIREGMWGLLIKWESLPIEKRVRHHLIDDILKFQSEWGVVIKVEREDAHVLVNVEDRPYAGEVFLPIRISDLEDAGYVAVEPLIEEE